jgi:gluconate 2-dehydrogenase gamma chain
MAVSGTVAVSAWPVQADTGTALTEATVAPGCKVLTVEQAFLLEALAEQIVPADDFPGAKEAGAVMYIDGVLAGNYRRFYKDRYAQGLALFDTASGKRFGKKFVSLNSSEQTQLVKAMDSGEAGGSQGKSFFSLLVRHVMEGYYGDPQHGANRGAASWKMIKFLG